MRDDFFTNTITRDMRDLFCGKRLGNGMSREVFAFKHQKPTAVIKFETDDQAFQDVMEQEVRDTEFAKWFAPVLDISPNGAILLMRRTNPITVAQLPERMPSFFTDLGMPNFGLLEGNVVCHDYGLNLLIARGLSKRMRKVDWWGMEGSDL